MFASLFSHKALPQAGFDVASCLSVDLWQPKWSFATLTRPYQDYAWDCGGQGREEQEKVPTHLTIGEYRQLLTQSFQPPNTYTQAQAQPQPQSYQQQSITPLLLSQMSAPELSCELDQAQILSPQMQSQMVQVSSSHCGSPYKRREMRRYQQTAQLSCRRSHPEDFTYDCPPLQQLQAYVGSTGTPISVELIPHGHQVQLQPSALPYQLPSLCPSPLHTHPGQAFHTLPSQPQYHHHHNLPSQPPRRKAQRTGYGGASSSAEEHGRPSVVGQPGMPAPAARQKGPKLEFTSKDDALLVELKETKNLTWKQIADFFPGRSSGTLQVRYCTKLKAKTSKWTDEMVRQSRYRRRVREH